MKEERRPSKVWSDTDSSTGEHKYDLYYQDKEVKNAARFRDGLVSDVYKKFDEDFCYSFWADEYKKHSTIVYKYETGAPSVQHPFCTHDTHTIYLNNGLCSESIDQINLMAFHIDSIEGDQSQVIMRDKIFSVLRDDIQKLPKSPFKERSKASQVKHVHALAVVLHTIADQVHWIRCKVYGPEDFDGLFDASARVQNVMTMLMRDEIFNDVIMYKMFISYRRCVRRIDVFNDECISVFDSENIKKKRFFTPNFLTKLSMMEKLLIAKYGEWKKGSNDGEEVDQEEG